MSTSVKVAACQQARFKKCFSSNRLVVSMVQNVAFALSANVITFMSQELTEEDTPGLALKQLATIEVKFTRCREIAVRAWTDADNAKDWDSQPVGPINEKTKKDAMLGAVTK